MTIQAKTDYINISVPLFGSEDVLASVMASLHPLCIERNDVSTDNCTVLHVGKSGGVLKVVKAFGVMSVSASGALLDDLVFVGQFEDFVYSFDVPVYRVTRLDAAVDFYNVDSPSILRSLFDDNCSQGIRLGRGLRQQGTGAKVRLGMWDCRKFDGRPSGTVYIGAKSSDKTARVYDKRKQLYDVKRQVSEREILRYELTVGKDTGCSLSDVLNPTALWCEFMHFICTIVDVPSMGWKPSAPDWVTVDREDSGPKNPWDSLYDVLGSPVSDLIYRAAARCPDDTVFKKVQAYINRRIKEERATLSSDPKWWEEAVSKFNAS